MKLSKLQRKVELALALVLPKYYCVITKMNQRRIDDGYIMIVVFQMIESIWVTYKHL